MRLFDGMAISDKKFIFPERSAMFLKFRTLVAFQKGLEKQCRLGSDAFEKSVDQGPPCLLLYQAFREFQSLYPHFT